MEIVGWIGFAIAVMNIGASSKVKKLSKRVRQLEKVKNQKGEKAMSKMIENLVGSNCVILFEEEIQMGPYAYDILEADEEWLKISRVNKKGKQETRIVRIDSIKELKPEA